MGTPTPRAQMKWPLVASYLPGRTLLSILLCELLCGRGMETSQAGLAADEAARAERLISATGLGFAASEAAGRFRHHLQQVIDEDFAVLLRWLRLALTSKSPTEQ